MNYCLLQFSKSKICASIYTEICYSLCTIHLSLYFAKTFLFGFQSFFTDFYISRHLCHHFVFAIFIQHE